MKILRPASGYIVKPSSTETFTITPSGHKVHLLNPYNTTYTLCGENVWLHIADEEVKLHDFCSFCAKLSQ